MAHLSLRLLGRFEAVLDDRLVSTFSTDKARALLAYLAVEADTAHNREALTGLLWPDQPQARASQNLRQALSYVRQALGDRESSIPFLHVTHDAIQFNRESEHGIDTAAFTDLIASSRSHLHRRRETCCVCMDRLREAIKLYRGDFLQHLYVADSQPFEEWALLKREWLRRQAVEALADLATYHERRGERDTAAEYARQHVALEPWAEEAHRHLMRLLAAGGQRSAALAQYESCRRALEQELGVTPSEPTRALHAQICSGESIHGDAAPCRLPITQTSFVGRRQELARLGDLIEAPDARLITLLGPGGSGKTRLAIAAAAEQQGSFAHGIYFVPLDQLTTADLLAPTLARALGFCFQSRMDPAEQLLDYLREKEMLLVLDGAEHLLECTDFLGRLLAEAAGVVLLVTSRGRLNLREEWIYAVEGLRCAQEAPGQTSPEVDAVELFVQRARQAGSHFAPTAEDFPSIGRLCRIVEGLPLALEMAATWAPDRPCAEIVEALERDLDVLTSELRNVPTRQRSMRATFEHSWALLNPLEQSALCRLAVFRGGFDLAAAQAVAETDTATLGALVDKSLLRYRPGGRYRLHELVRQYAETKQIDGVDWTARTLARHARYYAGWLQQLAQGLKGDRGGQTQAEALDAIESDIDNVRAAWQWSLASLGREDPAVGAAEALNQSAESLGLFYTMRSWYEEGEAAFRQAAAAVEAAGALPGLDRDVLLARLLAYQGRCCEFTTHSAQATQLYERSLALLRQIGADDQTALPRYGLGYMAYLQGRYPEARQHFEASLTIYRRIDEPWGAAGMLNRLAEVDYRQGAFEEARAHALEGLALRRATGDLRGIASSLNTLSLAYLRLGEYAAAREALTEALQISRTLDNKVGAANVLTSLSSITFRLRDIASAERYAEESLALYRETGDRWGVAIVLGNLAHMAMEQNDNARAEPLCRESVAVFRQVDVRAGLANALSTLGEICFRLGRHGEARVHLREALQIGHAAGGRPVVLESLGRLGLVLAAEGNMPLALRLQAFAVQQSGLGEAEREKIAGWLAQLSKQQPAQTVDEARRWAQAAALDELIAAAMI